MGSRSRPTGKRCNSILGGHCDNAEQTSHGGCCVCNVLYRCMCVHVLILASSKPHQRGAMSLGNGKRRTQQLGADYRLGALRLVDGLRAGGVRRRIARPGAHGSTHTIPIALITFPWPGSGRSRGCSLRAAHCNVTRRNARRFLREAIPGPKNLDLDEVGGFAALCCQHLSQKLQKERGWRGAASDVCLLEG